MGIANYVRNGRRFGDRKMLTGGQNQKNEPPARRTIAAIGRAEKRLKSLWVEGASKRH